MADSDGSSRNVATGEIQDFRNVSSDDKNKTISRVSKQKQCVQNMRRTDLTSLILSFFINIGQLNQFLVWSSKEEISFQMQPT